MTWIDVDAEKLRTAASTLQGVAGEAGSLADYAKEADPDWWMWGLGGIPFAALYFPVAMGVVHPAFQEVVDSIEGLSASLQACADDHAGNEDAIASGLERIAGQIEAGEI